jgi:flagellar secretion chaperone FliS
MSNPPFSDRSLASAQSAFARARAQRAMQQYQQVQTLTVTPGQLVILLYDGAIRFLHRARQATEEHQIEAAHNTLLRAEDIIAELDATLDETKGGEIVENLHSLYLYCYRKLIEANMNKQVPPIDEVIGILESLLDAWRTAVAEFENQGTPGNADGMQIEFPKD